MNFEGIDLSIIILSYKSREHLKVLLPSVFGSEEIEFYGENVAQAPGLLNQDNQQAIRLRQGFVGQAELPDYQQAAGLPGTISQRAVPGLHYTVEVIIVDNGSNDGTVEWLYSYKKSLAEKKYKCNNFQLIKNTNSGFAKGNNIGIKRARGRYILLLNPDTRVEPDTLRVMLDFMDSRSEVGISGCKIIKPDGRLDLACRRRFPNPWNSFKRLFLKDNTDYNYSDIGINESIEVDSVVGAFMLARTSVIEKIGLLDERFFMYGEDLDWCWQCKAAGFKVWYYPKTFITHYKGESSKQIPFRALKWFHDAMWIFYGKHYAGKYPFFFNWLVWVGIYGRMTALVIINLFKKKPAVSK